MHTQPEMENYVDDRVADCVDRRSAEQLGLGELLAEDLATHGGALLSPGFLAMAVHRCGRRAARLESRVLRALIAPWYKAAAAAIAWLWGIRLPREVQVGRRVRLWHHGGMMLQARFIGDDVQIARGTTFGPLSRTAEDAAELPIIEDGVDFGAGARVLGPVTVGRKAMVGAHSLVVENVPPGSPVLGVLGRRTASAVRALARAHARRDADRQVVGGDVGEHDGVRPDLSPVADVDGAKDLGPRPYVHAVAQAGGGAKVV